MVKYMNLTANKVIELQVNTFKNLPYFDFHIEWSRKQDHAGLQLTVIIGCLYSHLWICDNRHWDHETNDWKR